MISFRHMLRMLLALTLLVLFGCSSIKLTGANVTIECGTCYFQFSWGSTGSGSGEFHSPHGIAVDGSGNVYVADQGNSRIQKFTDTGTYLTQWSSFGPGRGQFYDPYDVAVAPWGNVYVTDYLNDSVEVFTASGAYVTA